jgi:hypothetical protein
MVSAASVAKGSVKGPISYSEGTGLLFALLCPKLSSCVYLKLRLRVYVPNSASMLQGTDRESDELVGFSSVSIDVDIFPYSVCFYISKKSDRLSLVEYLPGGSRFTGCRAIVRVLANFVVDTEVGAPLAPLAGALSVAYSGHLQVLCVYAGLTRRAAFGRWFAPLGTCESVVYTERPFAGRGRRTRLPLARIHPRRLLPGLRTR